MDIKSRLVGQLQFTRNFTEALLKAFASPEQFTYQVHPQTNHALWFMGHIGVVENFMIRQLDPSQVQEPDGYRDKFGMGSRPVSDARCYPSPAEVMAYMRERREATLAILGAMTDDDLAKPCGPGAPPFMTDLASVLEAAAWHEAMHAGQLSVVRRALGHRPMIDAMPAPEQSR